MKNITDEVGDYKNITIENYKKYFNFTPYQMRDMLLEEQCAEHFKILSVIKNLANEEQKRRKELPDEFVECPYCRGYHNELNNIDKLCEKCEQFLHVIEFDKNYNKT